MSDNVPGANNQKAISWVKSFEAFDNDDTSLKYDAWAGWYVEVRRCEMSNEELGRMSRRCWSLFHTSMWALEWNEDGSRNPI